jgi:protein-S-isoprenylcysteine O-methyltransferase Ste14
MGNHLSTPRMKGLARQTILGFVILAVILGAGIFVPAWTLDYWQAWCFIAVYLGCAVLITIYLWIYDPKLLERRVRGGPIAEKRKTQQIISLFASIGYIGLLAIPALDHRLQWSHVPRAVVVLGDVLVAVGCYLVFLVFRENSFTSATIEIAGDQKVISTGPYSIVRHPMYSGALILLFGTPLALGSYWGLVALVAMIPAFLWRVFDEESFLAKNLPGYEEYQAKVRWRLIPGII